MLREFQDLHKSNDFMAEITTKFRERALLVSQYAANEEMKKTRYRDILRDTIRDFVSFSGRKTLNDMIARAWEWEIEQQVRMKCKPE